MKITSIKTHKITTQDTSIIELLDRHIQRLEERSVVVVTSKIISLCEGRVVNPESASKEELVKQEAEQYLPAQENEYNVFLTIARGVLAPTAGIDESNADNQYVLWPKDPQASANEIREYLVKKHSIKNVGVIITDSKTMPLRWGTTGFALAHSGFKALNDYRGKKDLFGRELKMTQANVADGLAAAAVVAIGEGAEQTPIAIIEDVSFVQFQERNPTAEELKELRIALDEDLYAPLLKSVKWQKGRGSFTA